MKVEEERPRDRVLPTETVREMLNIGKTRFSQMINDPEKKFPRPVDGISKVRHGFLESEVIAWLHSRPRVEPPKAPKPFTGLADAKRITTETEREAV